MIFLKDPKVWMISLQCLTIFVLIIMKFNDLVHIGKDVTELKKDVKSLNTRVSNIEGKLSK